MKTLKEGMRDFVFGMEDGLVSNLGLVLGVYIGGGGKFAIVLAGLASMFAGAFSMSAGSYLSAKSQREVYEQEIKVTEEKVHKNPKKCMAEMKKILRKEGVGFKETNNLMKKFSEKEHPKFICNYLVQKKVGISKTKFDMPLQNAITMFFSFLVGSCFPILPFILLVGSPAVYTAVVGTVIALFTVGILKTIYTKRSWLKSGIEIVVVGLGAGFMGYLVGVIISSI
jgi:predicted membrane protein (TIGR00267 family)